MRGAIVMAAAALLMIGMYGYGTGSRGADVLPVSVAPTAVSTPPAIRATELANPWGAVGTIRSDAAPIEPLPAVAPTVGQAPALPLLRGVLQRGEGRLALWQTQEGTLVTACGEHVGHWTVTAITDTEATLENDTAVIAIPLTEES